jgi:hypothetical protein
MSEGVTSSPPPAAARCPECDAPYGGPESRRCWLCGANLPSATGVSEGGPPRGGAEEADRPHVAERDSRVGLIVLGVLFLLVGVGLIGGAPCPGAVLILLAAVALLLGVRRTQREGGPTTAGDARPTPAGAGVASFVASLGLLVLVGVAAYITFVATCFTVGFGTLVLTGGEGREGGIVFAVVLGGGCGLAAAGYVVSAIWRKYRRREG